jgi:hypothetical protein
MDNESPITPQTTPGSDSRAAPAYKIIDHTYDVVVVGAGGSGLRLFLQSLTILWLVAAIVFFAKILWSL